MMTYYESFANLRAAISNLGNVIFWAMPSFVHEFVLTVTGGRLVKKVHVSADGADVQYVWSSDYNQANKHAIEPAQE